MGIPITIALNHIEISHDIAGVVQFLYLYLLNGPGREDVIGQVGCSRPVVKIIYFEINIKLCVAIKVMI